MLRADERLVLEVEEVHEPVNSIAYILIDQKLVSSGELPFHVGLVFHVRIYRSFYVHLRGVLYLYQPWIEHHEVPVCFLVDYLLVFHVERVNRDFYLSLVHSKAHEEISYCLGPYTSSRQTLQAECPGIIPSEIFS